MRFSAGQLVVIYDQVDSSGKTVDEQQGVIIGEAYLDGTFTPPFEHDDAKLRFYDVLVGGRIMVVSDVLLDLVTPS